jgi:tape measure domain-containing protein
MSKLIVSLSIQALSDLTGITRTQSALKKLQTTLNNVSSYRKTSQALMQKGKAFRVANKAVNDLKAAYKQGALAPDKFRTQIKKASLASKAAREAYVAEGAALKKLKEQLTAAKVSVGRLGEAEDDLRRRVNRLNGRLSRQSRVVGGFGASFKHAGAGAKSLFINTGKMLAYGNLAVGGLRQIGAAAGAVALPFIHTASAMEQYQFRLSSILGSQAAGKNAMQWITDFTKANPAAPLTDMADAFAMMTEFGMPAKSMMKGVLDYNSALGGSAENLRGIVLQLGQAWSKGTIQYQDAIPLLQRGVSIYKLLANYSKRTQPASQQHDESWFAAMSSKGGLGRDAIKAIVEEMEFEQKGAAQKVGSTWQGLINQIKLKWQLFQLQMMKAGVFDALKEQLSRLSAWFDEQYKNGNMKKWATWVRTRMVPAIKQLGDGIFKLVNGLDKIGKFFGFLNKVAGYTPLGSVRNRIMNADWDHGVGAFAKTYFMGPSAPAVPTLREKNQQMLAANQPGVGVLNQQQLAHLTVTVEDKMTRVKTDAVTDGLTIDTLVGRNLVGAM